MDPYVFPLHKTVMYRLITAGDIPVYLIGVVGFRIEIQGVTDLNIAKLADGHIKI